MQDTTDTPLNIRQAPGKWVVYALGGIFGETTRALFVDEPGREMVVFVPREDVAMAFLDRTDHVTESDLMGRATHYSLDTKSQVLANAAYSFEDPLPAASALKDYMAFDEAQVTVERQAKA